MIVGHSMAAFAVVAGVGAALGWPRRRALLAGATAAAFALVPDVDMVYGLVVVATVEAGPPVATLDAFWVGTSRVHRFATHFLATGAVAALGFAAVGRALDADRAGSGLPWLAAGIALLCGLVAAGDHRFGAMIGAVLGVYALAGIAVAVVAVRRAGLDPTGLAVAAAVGLLSHPFGDLLTGEPPALFYPLARGFPARHVALHPDPTLGFLAVFAVELSTVWAALWAYRRLTGLSVRRHVDYRALLGVPYALVALVAPVPSPLVSYYPSISVLAVGGLGVLVVRPDRSVRRLASRRRWSPDRDRAVRDAITALVALTLAVATYAGCYLALATAASAG